MPHNYITLKTTVHVFLAIYFIIKLLGLLIMQIWCDFLRIRKFRMRFSRDLVLRILYIVYFTFILTDSIYY